VSEPVASTIKVNGTELRVWTKGSGPKIGFFAGFGGLPRWIPFLDYLSKSRTVVVPSLPGFPGGGLGHKDLDNHLDWVLAVRQVVEKSGLSGSDLVGSSVGASLAAEVAAIWPNLVRRLVLISPFGLFDEKEPTRDVWAIAPTKVAETLCAKPAAWNELKEAPAGENSMEWAIEQIRADEAAARAFFPLGDTRLSKRLGLIKADTLLLWGDEDKIIPRSYARKFKAGIKSKVKLSIIESAGHLAEIDQPEEVAKAAVEWAS
jgi:pimeloyl-ACP methyl ester carboxylesterase